MLSSRDVDGLPALCSLRCPPLAKLTRQVLRAWHVVLPPAILELIQADEKRFSADPQQHSIVPGFARFSVRDDDGDQKETEEDGREKPDSVAVALPSSAAAPRADSVETVLRNLVFALNDEDKQTRKQACAQFHRLFPKHGSTALFHPSYTLSLLVAEIAAEPSFRSWSVAWLWSLLTEPITVKRTEKRGRVCFNKKKKILSRRNDLLRGLSEKTVFEREDNPLMREPLLIMQLAARELRKMDASSAFRDEVC